MIATVVFVVVMFVVAFTVATGAMRATDCRNNNQIMCLLKTFFTIIRGKLIFECEILLYVHKYL